MTEQYISSKFRFIFLISIFPFLVGSQCTVLFNSGGNDDKDKEEDEIVVVTASGVFGSTPIAGANYASGNLRGVTGSKGEFDYEPGTTVQFSIGDIALGKAVDGKSLITAADLVTDDAVNTSADVNIKRLLKSLDADPDTGHINIPPQVRSQAVSSNSSVSASIEFLDFTDDTTFANTASQLVAVLTQDYPFTAVLQ